MSDESLFERMRDELLLPGDANPAAVLEAAHARRDFLLRQSKEGKKVQRDGAERKLRELEPILPELEIACELLELEAHAAGRRGPLRKHELNLRAAKLGARLQAMTEGDARILRTARLADAAVVFSGPDERELREIDAALEAARERAGAAAAADLPALADELAALRERIERLPEGAKRAESLRRHAQVGAAHAQRRAALEHEALAAGLEAVTARIPDVAAAHYDALRLELDALRARIENVSEAGARAMLLAKLAAAGAALEHRGEQLEAALRAAQLDAFLAKVSALTAPELDPAQAELDGLRASLEKISAAARPALALRQEQAAAALQARRAELAATELLAAAEACLARAAAAAGPAIAAAIKELQDFAGRIAKLPATPPRAALAAKIPAAIADCEQRREVFAIETALKALDEAVKTPGVTDLPERGQKIAARIDQLPAGEMQTALKIELHRILPEPTVPQPPPISLEQGEVLRLAPMALNGSLRPLPEILFVARSRFVLGRYPTRAEATVSADFSCPLTMKKISREHVVLQRMGREILAQEGPTVVNGSWIADNRLSKNQPAPVKFAPAQEIVLGFGPVLTVIAQHLAAAAPEGPPIVQRQSMSSFRPPSQPNLLTGAVRFVPKPAMELPALAAWIFTDGALGSAPASAIVLPSDFPATVGRVHYWDGGFWFENASVQPPVRLGAAGSEDGAAPRPLAPNEVVPLHSGDTLHFGPATFKISVGG